MLAIGLKKGIKEVVDPEIEKPTVNKSNEVLVKVLKAGIDGTDRNIVRWNLFDPPPGEEIMILGHEAVGRVEEAGSDVKSFKVGDIVVPVVRHGCNQCPSCLHGQSDMCSTGLYKERGIHKLHGYFTEYIVEEEEYLVPVPSGIESLAVLAEPLSISEKAISEITHIQSRLPWSCAHPQHRYDTSDWGQCKKALVVGAGPLGFLGACLLRLYGIETYVAVNRSKNNLKVRLVEELGAHYVDSRNATREEIIKKTGTLDIIIEASGVSPLALDLITALGRNAIYVLTGIPRGKIEFCLDSNAMLRQLVRYNQVIIGSVNSNRKHFVLALQHLVEMKERFGPIINKVITKDYSLKEYKEAFTRRDPEEIKAVFDMEK